MSAELALLYRRHVSVLNSRLESALSAVELEGMILHAGTAPQPIWDDQPYSFRAYPLFAQWCPHPSPEGAVMILEPGSKPRLLLIRTHDFWHASPAPPEDWWADVFEVDYAASADALDHVLVPFLDRFGIVGDATTDANERLKVKANECVRYLDYLRAFKTDYEIECIRRANCIAARGHRAVDDAFNDSVSEFDLESEFMRASRQRHWELPYPNIVAMNEHAAILHYQRLDATAPAQSGVVLIDAGARCNGYAADITRTHVLSASPLQEIFSSLESMQQILCAEALPGVEFAQLNDRAHQLLAALLVEHEVVRASLTTAYESGLTRLFLPHGLGHLLGLQVHDPCGWQRAPVDPPVKPPPEHPFLRLTRKLEPGFVVTIEPGIYIIESLLLGADRKQRELIDWKAIDRLKSSGGVRIEDDVAVEAGDNKNLSREAFATLDAG